MIYIGNTIVTTAKSAVYLGNAGLNSLSCRLVSDHRAISSGSSIQRRNVQVVGQPVQLQPDIVVAELPARQPRPVEGVLAFLDVLLGGAALIVKTHYPRHL